MTGEVILDVDAAIVEIHSANMENAASHFKRGYGFDPMFCTLDATGGGGGRGCCGWERDRELRR